MQDLGDPQAEIWGDPRVRLRALRLEFHVLVPQPKRRVVLREDALRAFRQSTPAYYA